MGAYDSNTDVFDRIEGIDDMSESWHAIISSLYDYSFDSGPDLCLWHATAHIFITYIVKQQWAKAVTQTDGDWKSSHSWMIA